MRCGRLRLRSSGRWLCRCHCPARWPQGSSPRTTGLPPQPSLTVGPCHPASAAAPAVSPALQLESIKARLLEVRQAYEWLILANEKYEGQRLALQLQKGCKSCGFITGNDAADLKHKTLLWVHHKSLRGMDAKTGRIKVLHTMHKSVCSNVPSARSSCKTRSMHKQHSAGR